MDLRNRAAVLNLFGIFSRCQRWQPRPTQFQTKMRTRGVSCSGKMATSLRCGSTRASCEPACSQIASANIFGTRRRGGTTCCLHTAVHRTYTPHRASGQRASAYDGKHASGLLDGLVAQLEGRVHWSAGRTYAPRRRGWKRDTGNLVVRNYLNSAGQPRHKPRKTFKKDGPGWLLVAGVICLH